MRIPTARSNRNQILKNFADMPDRQRIMSFVWDESRFAILETVRHFFRQPNGEGTIFHSVPEPHGHLHIFDRESPRLRVDLCIDHYSFR